MAIRLRLNSRSRMIRGHRRHRRWAGWLSRATTSRVALRRLVYWLPLRLMLMPAAVTMPVARSSGVMDDDRRQAALRHGFRPSIVAEDLRVHVPGTGAGREAAITRTDQPMTRK